jgi:hypothetical protein
VKARQTIAIPDKGPMPPFTLRIRRPLGTEVLQVIASTRPIAELDALDLRENKLPVVSLETLDRLRDRLLREPVAWTEHRLTLRTVPSATPRPSEKAARMGLFIGIGKYRNDKVAPPHEELRKSAEEMHRLMLARGGLDPARTKLVTDHQATKKNLEDLITRWLPSISRPGDTVFIYFSGHAGQTGEPGSISPRSFPTEPDNKNELLGPYDIEPGDRFRDTGILDDTFSRWLQELTGRQVVVILDTCHAGGFIAGKHLTGFTQRSARLKNISQMNTLVLTSTSADEQALFEGMPNHTMWYTYFLTQALENDNLPRPLTVQQAHAYAAKGVQEMLKKKKEARVQEPQMADNVLLPVVMVPN